MDVKKTRETFTEGLVIELIEMAEERYAPPAGTKGTVEYVDDMGTVHVRWENGSSLGLLPEIDRYRIIKEA